MDTTYRWFAPDNLVQEIMAQAAQTTGWLVVHKRDEPAARATLVADRITTLPHVGPQPGHLWVEVAHAA